MGRNLPAKRYKKSNPTQRTLRFLWEAGDSENSVYIDIAKSLSAINSKAYRQGLYYYVSKITVQNSGNCWFRFNTLPDTYVTQNAWKRGKKVWDKMNRIAAGDSGRSIYPAYHDFKVAMSSAGAAQPGSVLETISAIDATTIAWIPDEWALSKYVSGDPVDGAATPSDAHFADEFVAHMLGGDSPSSGTNLTSVGLIRSYCRTRAQRTDDTPVISADSDDDVLANLFDFGDSFDEIRDNLDEINDLAPYDADGKPGTASVFETVIQSQCATGLDAGQVAVASGFCVPFGLLQVTTKGGTDVGAVEILIELAPGPYHGVFAENP